MNRNTTPRTTRSLLAAALFVSAAMGTAADPQPTGATDGVVIDSPAPGITDITAPDNAIIDYASFDIGSGETVNFIQPDADSRVLNRIHSNLPTQIDGTINANGIVYFVNPAGVQFGPGSVVDAAGVFAAGASLSDADFLSGTNQFNSVTGNVTAAGTIRAQTIAALVGRNVTNTGTISVPDGTVVMASGESVYIGAARGGIMLQVEATPLADGEGSVNQDGTVEAAEVSLVAGDLYSLAMTSDIEQASTADPTPIRTIAEIDTDGDGDIDNDDLDTAFANFTGPLPPGTGGKTQAQGDTDGDGDVDNTDIGTLIIYFTGPRTSPPPEPPSGEFNLDAVDAISELPPITQDVNLTEADLGILRDQLGIAARQPLAEERIEHAEARGLYDDFDARPGNAPNDDGSLTIANTRLDAEVVRAALQLYRDQIGVEGVSPADRAQQIRDQVALGYEDFTDGASNQPFDAQAFIGFLLENNPELVANLGALNELRGLTGQMGLTDFERDNSDQTIINRSRPEALTYEQMRDTLEAAVLPVDTAGDQSEGGAG